MPLDTIRRYIDLVRRGNGNEADRLGILRAHRQRLTSELDQLKACLDLIDSKIDLYEKRLAEGSADRLWNPVRGDNV